jgi:hypothetical protein
MNFLEKENNGNSADFQRRIRLHWKALPKLFYPLEKVSQ